MGLVYRASYVVVAFTIYLAAKSDLKTMSQTLTDRLRHGLILNRLNSVNFMLKTSQAADEVSIKTY